MSLQLKQGDASRSSQIHLIIKWSNMLTKQILPIGLYKLPPNRWMKVWVVIWRPELVSR